MGAPMEASTPPTVTDATPAREETPAQTRQYSLDGKWWWDGTEWLAVAAAIASAQPPGALASGPMHKNGYKLPPGEYTRDRKHSWRLENGQWLPSGKWEWDGNQYVQTEANPQMLSDDGPSKKLLKWGSTLIFRDGSTQELDEQRQTATWRTTRAQGVSAVIAFTLVGIALVWWGMDTFWPAFHQ